MPSRAGLNQFIAPMPTSSNGLQQLKAAAAAVAGGGNASDAPHQNGAHQQQQDHSVTPPNAAAAWHTVPVSMPTAHLQQGKPLQRPAEIPTSAFSTAAAAGGSSLYIPAQLHQDELRQQKPAGVPTSTAAGPVSNGNVTVLQQDGLQQRPAGGSTAAAAAAVGGLQPCPPLMPRSGHATPLASPSDSDSFQSVLSGPIPIDPSSLPTSNGNDLASLHSLPSEPYAPDAFGDSSRNGFSGQTSAHSIDEPIQHGRVNGGEVQHEPNRAGRRPKPGRLGQQDPVMAGTRDLQEGSSGATLATNGDPEGRSQSLEPVQNGAGHPHVGQNNVQVGVGIATSSFICPVSVKFELSNNGVQPDQRQVPQSGIAKYPRRAPVAEKVWSKTAYEKPCWHYKNWNDSLSQGLGMSDVVGTSDLLHVA